MRTGIARFAMGGIIIPFCLGWTAPAVAAEPGPRPEPALLRVAASSTVKARPDRALISIGVVTQSAKAQDAAEQNARQTAAVIAELKKSVGAKGDIKTAHYQLAPVYGDHRSGKEGTITGYSASNTVQVTLDDLDLVGKSIDAAARTGANAIQGLHFLLKDDSAFRKKALQDAVLMARGKAESMAAAAGVKIVRVLSLDEGGEAFPPVPMRAWGGEMAMSRAATAPIEAGDMDIRAAVSIAYEIAP